MFGRASTRVPVAFGRAPLLVRLAIFIGIVRRLFDGLEGNAVEVDTMNALAIEHLGLCGEAICPPAFRRQLCRLRRM
jgi:hypothetical protein